MLPLKRKEKARIAARLRRSQEANTIIEMAQELNITQEKMRRIDKATILRLAIDYIKAFEVLCRPCATCSTSAVVAVAPVESEIETATATTTILTTTTTTSSNSSSSSSSNSNSIQYLPANFEVPKLSTDSIFAPKTNDMDRHFLMIDETRDGKPAFVFKPDDQILDEDDLTHLAPQAGDCSISLEAESLEEISLDASLFLLKAQ